MGGYKIYVTEVPVPGTIFTLVFVRVEIDWIRLFLILAAGSVVLVLVFMLASLGFGHDEDMQ